MFEVWLRGGMFIVVLPFLSHGCLWGSYLRHSCAVACLLSSLKVVCLLWLLLFLSHGGLWGSHLRQMCAVACFLSSLKVVCLLWLLLFSLMGVCGVHI